MKHFPGPMELLIILAIAGFWGVIFAAAIKTLRRK
jgi:hypothetical protein